MDHTSSHAVVENVLRVIGVGGHAGSWWIRSCFRVIVVEMVLPFSGVGGHASS